MVQITIQTVIPYFLLNDYKNRRNCDCPFGYEISVLCENQQLLIRIEFSFS